MIDYLPYDCRPLRPRILRARFNYLYDDRGRRYLDLGCDFGRGLLGARPEGVMGEVKAVLSRGLWQGYPSVYGPRLVKALNRLIPSHPAVRVFANGEHAEDFLKELFPGQPAVDPALQSAAGGELPPGQGVVAYWRPFCGEPPAGVQVLIPVLPFPGNFAPCPLCFSPSAAPSLPSEAGFDDASPALLAGLAAAAVLLSRFIRRTPPAGWWEALADLPYPRRGPYLRTLGVIGPRYGEFFTQALAEGFLPPASPALPLIVPPGLSAGELKKLKALLGRFG